MGMERGQVTKTLGVHSQYLVFGQRNDMILLDEQINQ